MANRKELTALKTCFPKPIPILSTTKLPENRSALALTDDLLSPVQAVRGSRHLGAQRRLRDCQTWQRLLPQAGRTAQDSRRWKTAQGIGIVALPSITLLSALLLLPWWRLLSVRKNLLCPVRHGLEGAIYPAGEGLQCGNRGKRN